MMRPNTGLLWFFFYLDFLLALYCIYETIFGVAIIFIVLAVINILLIRHMESDNAIR